MALTKTQRRYRIKKRIRKVISGTKDIPRLSVFRSNKQIYAQIIDDLNCVTLISASSRSKEFGENDGNKTAQAEKVGKIIAERAKAAGIEKVVFDRNGYLYHGRIKALADSARKNGLNF